MCVISSFTRQVTHFQYKFLYHVHCTITGIRNINHSPTHVFICCCRNEALYMYIQIGFMVDGFSQGEVHTSGNYFLFFSGRPQISTGGIFFLQIKYFYVFTYGDSNDQLYNLEWPNLWAHALP